MTIQYFSSRTFQLWDYRVSHATLLVRSPRDASQNTNVDISCVGVEYLNLPTLMRGIEIVEPTLSELQHLEQTLDKRLTASSVFILFSSQQRFAIVAASFKIDENTMDIFESPFE